MATFAQALVLIYILLTLLVGYFTPRETSESGFIYAGRKLTLPAFVMTLVSTWYGGILEIGRFGYEHGIVSWLMLGIFYYIAAALYATVIGPKISKQSFGSIPELFNNYFGKKSCIIAAIMMIFIASPAPYLKMLSIMIEYLYDIDPHYGILIAAIISMIYTLKGGFRSVVRTDIIQFSMMYIGFIGILGYLYITYGGYSFLVEKLPDSKLSFPGDLSWGYICAWGFIALVTFVDPNFYQRSFSGASPTIVKKGIFTSILFWFVFDLISILTALYSAAIITDVQHSPFLDLVSIALPPLLQGIFMVSMFAIVMSTIDSFIFVSGLTIGRDLLSYGSNKSKTVAHTKIGIVISALFSVILATFFKNAIDIWYVTGSFAASSLLIPMLCCFYKKEIQFPVALIVIPIVVTAICFLWGNPNLDPMYPGLLSSVMCFLVFRK